jgi:hypothetical protein
MLNKHMQSEFLRMSEGTIAVASATARQVKESLTFGKPAHLRGSPFALSLLNILAENKLLSRATTAAASIILLWKRIHHD